MVNILVIGGGGRENAIIHSLKKSPLLQTIFCLPGNPGINKIAQPVTDISISDHSSIIKFCQKNKIDLVIIGPEQPLVLGLIDDLQKANIKAFGPTKNAAKLEGSKIFTKQICDSYSIPTAKYCDFDQENYAIQYLDEIGFPCVIKADGIAAGKGVIIAYKKEEAIDAIRDIFAGKFDNIGNQLIIEEFLEGVEVSFFAICDGKKAKFLGSAGDHKKVKEGEVGLNTGGMGTYSPSPFIDENSQENIMKNIINPAIKAMSDLGHPFVGILFAGLIITKDGPKLLEFNVRFGDPETQSILLRLESDLLKLILDASNGDLDDRPVKFSNKSSICVVMAANGYPEQYTKNTEIRNLEAAENSNKNIIIFHAGTKLENGKILANGGRVLGICALENNLQEAHKIAYQAIKKIDWKDGFYRTDIGIKAIEYQQN